MAVVEAVFDLSVTTFSVSDTYVPVSERITLSATVGNASSATVSSPRLGTLWYFRSTDATISVIDDTYIRSASVDKLAPSATFSKAIAVSVPSSTGTYYYGVCLTDRDNLYAAFYDNDTSNNCSAGVRVDVVAQAFDLSVTAFSVDPSSVVAGEAITLAATVTNASSATISSRGATLLYYRSSDATITSGDTRVGTPDSIGALAASATESETTTDSPSVAGTYYYGACVVVSGSGDSDSDSDPSNNCSAGVQVDVVQDFDLSVTAFSVDPSSVVAGNPITFSATVTNASSATVSSPVAALKYYRSTNATIDATDTEVGVADSIGVLAAAATESETAIVNPNTVGTYYYGACVVGIGDSDTSNDCSAGVQVDVSGEFDLSVTAFSAAPSSVVAGNPITFSATVTNASSATVSSPVAALKYYRSTNATIDATDTEVGVADSIGALAAAATESETAIVNPSTAGTYYYGACVMSTGDSDTSNNCSAGVRVDVSIGFDLSVTAFSAIIDSNYSVGSGSSPVAGDTIRLYATVGNASSANVSSPVATLRYYRSSDATIDATDTEVGTADSMIGVLAAAATTAAQDSSDHPNTAGTYYYGACVVGIGDSDTSNDCSAGVRMDVAAADFDLSVTAFSVSDSSIVTREPITLSATVTNAASATRFSAFASLQYYRSSDATITSADTWIPGNNDTIGPLAAAATSAQTAAVNAPSTAGTYYYGACVVSIGGGDIDTSNDCSAGVRVDVAQAFDLSVTAFSAAPSSVAAGEAITFAATVTNASSATKSSSVAELKYYRSTNATIDATDTEVGVADSIGVLAAAATESETAIVNPSTAGTYYYGACIVVTGDSDRSNDCSAGVRVDVAARVFDLSVTAFSVDPSSVVVGEAITFAATVTNASSATKSSPVAELKYYRSTNATIDATDTEVGVADSIGVLAAAATESETATDSPSVAGTYYYGACVVGTGDSDTSNNCSAGVQVDVSIGFDLSVTAFSVSDSSALTGDGITLTATVTNASSAMRSSPPFATLRYYRSTDATIDATDTRVNVRFINALAAGATSAEAAFSVVPSVVGTYYYGACVVDTVDSDASNNCSAGVRVDVAAREFDLSVTAFSVSDSSALAGDRITLTATVTNASSAMHSSPASTAVRYYRSTDATIDPTDTSVGSRYISELAAAASTSAEVDFSVPWNEGTYYYGACIVVTGDSDTSNDCSAGVRVVVTAREFDLSVTASVSDSSVLTDARITFSATVTNASSAMHSSPEQTAVRYYRSTDATIDPTDTFDGIRYISELAAGATESETISSTVPSVAGTYYYGACVADTVDSDTSNDCSAGVRVDVAARGEFDLSVTAFSVSDSSALTGDRVTFSATVTNAASAMHPSPYTTLRYYRSTDATIDPTDTYVDSDSISELAAGATYAQTAAYRPSTAGTYYYGACTVANGDGDASNNCSAGVQVVVTARDFDLSVTAFSVSDSSIVVGESITFSATVGNDSSAMHPSPSQSRVRLRYYRSSDATIDATDTPVNIRFINALAAGATESKTAIVNPSTAGTYYYGACVVNTVDSDTSNDCSAGVRVDVAARDFDLSVTAFSVSDSSALTGYLITLTATVTNDSSANVSSPVATLRYYRSSDATIDPTDTPVIDTEVYIGELAAGATQSQVIGFTIRSVVGTYYYGACVVGTGDSNTGNNCSTGVQVDVAARVFDLSVTTFTADPSSIVAGEAITFAATVTNASSATVSSPVAELKYYRSTNATIDSTTDTEVGTADSISALAAAATESETATDSPSTAGTYYYGACVAATADSDTSNNCSAGVQVQVSGSGNWDFEMALSVSDSTLTPSQAFTLSALVGNWSGADIATPAITLTYYRSSDSTLGASDTRVGTDSVPALSPGRTSSENISLTAPSTTGTYYYIACAPVDGAESHPSDNCDNVSVTVSSGGGGGGGGSTTGGACSVGQVLSAGDSCTLSNGGTLSVNSGGSLCTGNLCGLFNVGLGRSVTPGSVNGVLYTATLTRVSGGYRIDSL